MSKLRSSFEDYLKLRHSLGYKLERAGEVLDDFVTYMDRANESTVTISRALDWSTRSSDAGARWRAQQLGVVRVFSRYLLAFDSATEVPPSGSSRRGDFGLPRSSTRTPTLLH